MLDDEWNNMLPSYFPLVQSGISHSDLYINAAIMLELFSHLINIDAPSK